MRSLSQWRGLKLYREFNGPGGQPDPTGVSAPVLPGGTSGCPAAPTMGTQPGMMFPQKEEGDEDEEGGDQPPSHFRQIYDEFLAKLRDKSPKKAKKIADIVQKDVGEILAQKGEMSNGEQDEQGVAPLGEE